MPYIPQNDREDLLFFYDNDEDEGGVGFSRECLGTMLADASRNGGDLQYMLAVAINKYLLMKGLNYQNCQDIMGALTGALGEFQRTVVGPYEQSKIEENGVVYTVQGDALTPLDKSYLNIDEKEY